jgi:hypothetical protein
VTNDSTEERRLTAICGCLPFNFLGWGILYGEAVYELTAFALEKSRQGRRRYNGETASSI